MLGTRRYPTGTPTSALLQFFPRTEPSRLHSRDAVAPYRCRRSLEGCAMKSSVSVTNRKQTASFRIAGLMLAIAPLWLMLAAAGNSVQAQTTPSSADWTQFHRDNMQRWNPYETVLGVNNVGSLQLKWKNPTGGNYDYDSGYPGSSPAVANGVVYFGSLDNNVYALNASTGAKLWSYPTGSAVYSSPAVANGIVYVGSGDANVYALNASTGAKLWSYTTGLGIGSSPTVVNGVVYIGSDDGNAYALNASTGAKLWSYDTGGTASPVESSPAVANGVVYIDSFCCNLWALNASTGALLWSYPTQIAAGFSSSPAVANGVVYVGSWNENLYALNASTGALLWTYSVDGDGPVESSPAVANGVVYFASISNVYALNASTGALLWRHAAGPYVQSSPAVANGVVYVGSGGSVSGYVGWGPLYALNASTGALLWSSTAGFWNPSPAIVDGVLYTVAGDVPSCPGLSPPGSNYCSGIARIYAFSLPSAASADLFLRIRPTPETVQQGDLITYAFPVWDLGPGDAVHEVLTTQVPEGTTFDYIRISGTPGLGTCTTPPYEGTGEIVCNENSAMAPNTTWTVRLTVKVTAPAGTVITESAATLASTADPNLANNTATVSLTVVP
jgi:outer membrane protein assembly factor BamB